MSTLRIVKPSYISAKDIAEAAGYSVDAIELQPRHLYLASGYPVLKVLNFRFRDHLGRWGPAFASEDDAWCAAARLVKQDRAISAYLMRGIFELVRGGFVPFKDRPILRRPECPAEKVDWVAEGAKAIKDLIDLKILLKYPHSRPDTVSFHGTLT